MEDKENIFIKKLKDESINEFENYIPIIESEKKIKEVFYYFLYNDLIQVEMDNLNNIDINDIVNNPSLIIDQYLENIYSDILNSNDNLFEAFKKELIKKMIIIKNKIKECNNHIEIIKKEYINISLQKYLPPTNNTKNLLSFENKSVLYLFKKNDYNLLLSEFFTRVIFCSIEKKLLNNNSINILDLYNNFYNSNEINSYIDMTNGNINSFNNIKINFKYWIILLFLIGQIFSNKSKYSLIFNNIELNKNINLILHPKKEKKENKKYKKSSKKIKKRIYGGNKFTQFSKILEERKKNVRKNNKINKTENKKNASEYYNHILNDTYVNNTSLKNIYYNSFNNNIKQYFLHNLIFNPLNEKKDVKTINFVHPFTDKINIKLTDITEIKKPIIQNTNKITLFNNIKFNLYQSLYLLLDRNNQNDIEKFIENVKYRIIILLFYLYNIKLTIYKSYIEKINNIFNITSNKESNKKNNSKNISITKNSNKISKINNKIQKNNLIINKIYNNNDIDTKIKKKQYEINSIKNINGIKDYDEKILLLENELKKLIISKYSKQIKVTNK
jgi:hypothetical protein